MMPIHFSAQHAHGKWGSGEVPELPLTFLDGGLRRSLGVIRTLSHFPTSPLGPLRIVLPPAGRVDAFPLGRDA